MPAVTKEQDKRDLLKFQALTGSVDSKMEQTVKSLHEAADKLDDVWRDCKIAYAFGTAGAIASGAISLGAMVMTGGVASPLVYVGLGLGLGSVGINLGTSKIETAINSAEVEKAEKLLNETLDSIDKVQQLITNWLNKKEIARIVYICLLAKHLKVERHVLNFLSVVLSFCLGSPDSMSTAEMLVTAVSREGVKATAKTAAELGAQFADDFVQAAGTPGAAQVADDFVQAAEGVGGATATAGGGKAGAIVGGVLSKTLIVVNVAFLMADILKMGFTIRDLISNKGSDASKCLREMANQLKKTMTKQRNSQQIPEIDVCETLLDKQYCIEEIS